MEPNSQAISDKLWSIMHICLFMLKRGIAKNKSLLVLHHMMLKQGRVARRSLENIVLNHNSSFGCKSHNVASSFVSPREYEFSCSNTPVPVFQKRGKHARRRTEKELAAASGVRRMFEMLNSEVGEGAAGAVASPLVRDGRGVRQLRITDSPFPTVEEGSDTQVDKQAEEFIERFHEQLRRQQMMAA